MKKPKKPNGRQPNNPGFCWDGRALAARRGARGHTTLSLQDALRARGARVSRRTIQLWEQGRRAPTVEQATALGVVLECSPRALSRMPVVTVR